MKCRPIFSIALVVTALVGTIYSVQGTIPFFALNPNGQVAAVTGAIGKTYEVRTLGEFTSARESIKALPRDATWRGATIVLHGGYYNLTSTLALDTADSGTTAYPVIYMGAPGEQAVISGGKQLQSSWFSQVTSATPNYSKIPSSVRANVYVANLKANGITDYGTLKMRGWNNANRSFVTTQNTSPMELAFNGQMMTLARWPNFMQKTDGALNGFVRTAKMINETQFQFPGTRYQNWSQNDLWIEGLYNEYVDTTLKATISSSGLVTLSGIPGYVEEAIARGAAIYAFNLIEELDTPGEYYVDRANGLLYFYPPSPISGAKLDVSMLETPLISLNGSASNITLKNLIIESGRHMGIQKYGYGTHDKIIVENSILRNTGHQGINFTRTTNSGIRSSIVSGIGSGGINLHGGDRASLSPSGSFVENTEVYDIGRLDRTAIDGIRVASVGAIVRNNYIHDIPQTGIAFDGNNHLAEYNIFRRINYENSDAGVIYGGRDWGYQGNVIRYNIFDNSSTPTPQQVSNTGNNIGGGSLGGFAAYLDDGVSGFTIYGNIFYNSGSTAILYRGGFDTNIKNNIIVGSYNNCIVLNRPALYYPYSPSNDLLARLHNDSASGITIDYQSAAWKAAYPRLASMPNDWTIIKRDGWNEPRNSFIEKNICFGTPGNTIETGHSFGIGTMDVIRKYGGKVETPLVVDPKFVNPSAGNFNFQSSSPVYTIPGFEVIPVAKIGILIPYSGSGAIPATASIVATPINGSCNTTTNTCLTGTLSDTTDSSTNYLWSCLGANGGTNTSCSTIKPVVPQPVAGICGATNNSCSTGTLSDTTDSSTNYFWQCLGASGGPTASCSLVKPTNPTNPTISTNSASSPYKGTPQTIPGTVQVENYNEGGEGVAYHDFDTINNGKVYRNDGIDIAFYNNNYNIGWFRVGEWMEYTIRANESARYSVVLKMSNPSAGGSIKVTIDGKDVKTVTVPTLGSWTSQTLTEAFDVGITSGLHTIRITGVADAGWWVGDLDSIIFTKMAPISTKFKTGDNIKTTSSVNVRASASTSDVLAGSQASNALGTIVGGPIFANGYNWWNVNYLSGPDGWSVEDYLVPYIAPNLSVTGPSVTIYSQCNYQGTSMTLPVGSYHYTDLNANGKNLNNAVKSVRVPSGFTAVLYTTGHFTETGVTFTTDDPCIDLEPYVDGVSSAVITQTAQATVTIYNQCNYQGTSITLPVGSYNYTDLNANGKNMNNAVDSIRIPPGFKVILSTYGYIEEGPGVTLTKDDPCIDQEPYVDGVSSIRVLNVGTQ